MNNASQSHSGDRRALSSHVKLADNKHCPSCRVTFWAKFGLSNQQLPRASGLGPFWREIAKLLCRRDLNCASKGESTPGLVLSPFLLAMARWNIVVDYVLQREPTKMGSIGRPWSATSVCNRNTWHLHPSPPPSVAA